MKIVIIWRGPVRPDLASVIANVDLLDSCFKQYDVKRVLWTWDSPMAREVVGRFHECHLLPEPEGIFHEKFPRSYKQFWTLKQATTNVQADFVVQGRTDGVIEVDPALWLNPGVYTTIHAKGDHPNNPNDQFINDQFSVAEPEIMRKAWDYGDETALRAFMDAAHCPEDVLQQIIDKNGVSVRIATTLKWDLHPGRHGSQS